MAGIDLSCGGDVPSKGPGPSGPQLFPWRQTLGKTSTRHLRVAAICFCSWSLKWIISSPTTVLFSSSSVSTRMD